jgi:hypothetical protein
MDRVVDLQQSEQDDDQRGGAENQQTEKRACS